MAIDRLASGLNRRTCKVDRGRLPEEYLPKDAVVCENKKIKTLRCEAQTLQRETIRIQKKPNLLAFKWSVYNNLAMISSIFNPSASAL
jgi:hypothetical protein